jgi:hypothetical protein
MKRASTLAQTSFAGTDLLKIEPAVITALVPIVTPCKIAQEALIQTSSSILTLFFIFLLS